mmetsp:Transcript_43625/g.69794  ORF Transcript_43625/g.69794 Transcript_43625/m.69794 type:complete len:90 (-) Transcript_43625:167-436(-)
MTPPFVMSDCINIFMILLGVVTVSLVLLQIVYAHALNAFLTDSCGVLISAIALFNRSVGSWLKFAMLFASKWDSMNANDSCGNSGAYLR